MRVFKTHTVLNAIFRFRFLFRGLKISKRIRIGTCFFLCCLVLVLYLVLFSLLQCQTFFQFFYFSQKVLKILFSLVVVCGKFEEDFSVSVSMFLFVSRFTSRNEFQFENKRVFTCSQKSLRFDLSNVYTKKY